MDLFTKADKQKEFPDSNTVLIHLKSNGKFNVTIHDNFLTVEPRGFTNAVNKGLIGQKTYDLNNVSGVQYKNPDLPLDICRLFSSAAEMHETASPEL
ncbi:MAG: hypothetical protein ACLUJ1_12070 [Mediterraneibacter faecis]|jgi:hypothetical protein